MFINMHALKSFMYLVNRKQREITKGKQAILCGEIMMIWMNTFGKISMFELINFKYLND